MLYYGQWSCCNKFLWKSSMASHCREAISMWGLLLLTYWYASFGVSLLAYRSETKQTINKQTICMEAFFCSVIVLHASTMYKNRATFFCYNCLITYRKPYNVLKTNKLLRTLYILTGYKLINPWYCFCQTLHMYTKQNKCTKCKSKTLLLLPSSLIHVESLM